MKFVQQSRQFVSTMEKLFQFSVEYGHGGVLMRGQALTDSALLTVSKPTIHFR